MKQAGHKNKFIFPPVRDPRVSESMEAESRMVVVQGRGRGTGKTSLSGNRGLVWEDEKALEWDGDDGCTTR